MCQQQRRKIPSISQQKNNRCECCEAFIHSSFQKEITFSTRLDQSYIEQHLTRDPVQYKTCKKMKLATATLLTLLHQSSAFAPTPFTTSSSARSNTFKHSALVDPSIFADTHQHVDTLSNFFSSIILSDGDVSDSMNALADAATSAVSTTATDATAAASQDNGWFGFLEGPIEFLLQGIHSLLTSVGISENAWGVSILAMTTFIKLLTYPLTKSQLESTSKMQVGYEK